MSKQARRKPGMSVAVGSSSTADRIAWLLKEVWNDNRSAMARDIGVTHSALAKIVRGTHNPGQRLLRAVASHPKVNPGWLISGEGEPLLKASTAEPAGGWPVRIAQRLLPGPLDDSPNLLSDETFPVAGAYYRPSRYWYRLSAKDPLVAVPARRLAAGDLLLMETDASAWEEAEAIDRHLCAVRLTGADGPQLAVADWDPGNGYDDPVSLSVDTCQSYIGAHQKIEQFLIRKFPGGKVITKYQTFRLDRDEQGHTKERPLRNLQGLAGFYPVLLSQIVAVCLLSVRHEF